MIPVYITGSGVWNPPEVITNEELVIAFNEYVRRQNILHQAEINAGTREPLQPSSAEFIEKASGIKQRYVMEKAGVLDPDRMCPNIPERSNDEISLQAEIAVNAANIALIQAGRQGSDVDMIIVACSNMQRAYPAIAIEVQKALGAKGYGYDMNVACSSATFGIEQAANAIRCGQSECVLVINPEITSAHLAWGDRDCHFIFGDVATAVLVEGKPSGTQQHLWEILGSKSSTLFSNNIRNNFGFMNRCDPSGIHLRDKLFYQEGRKVFKEVCPLAAEHMESHLKACGFSPTQVRRFWLHQANLAMNQLIIKRMLGTDVGADVAPVILDRYANTASAGTIIAFHQHNNSLTTGDIGIICSFGAGYSIGSHVLQKRD